MAFNALIYFLKESEELVEVDKALEEEIYHKNVKLLIGAEIRLPNSWKKTHERFFHLSTFSKISPKVL